MTLLLAALLSSLAPAPQPTPAGTVYASHLMVDQEVTVSSRIRERSRQIMFEPFQASV